MKRILVAFIIHILLLSSPFAASMPPKPSSCPETSKLISAGLQEEWTFNLEDGHWAVSTPSQRYGTDNKWGFAVIVKAKSGKEAYQTSIQELSSLQFIFGPVDIRDKWVCIYETANGSKAVAVTPVEMSLKNIQSIIK